MLEQLKRPLPASWTEQRRRLQPPLWLTPGNPGRLLDGAVLSASKALGFASFDDDTQRCGAQARGRARWQP